MEEKDIHEFFEKGDQLSLEILKTIFHEGDKVPSNVVMYALAKNMASVLNEIKEQTGQENIVEEYFEVFKVLIVEVFLSPKNIEIIKRHREIVTEIVEKEKKIAENEKEKKRIEQKIAENEKKIAEIAKLRDHLEQEMKKYEGRLPKSPKKEIAN